jgi:predicted amidohydrolase
MTANRNLKRRVRARAAKTGESYTAALRHFRSTPTGDEMPETTEKSLRLAVAQTSVPEDPRDREALAAAGRELRELMRAAHARGARIVHFPEGATCFPHKRIMSATGPDEVGPADWDRFAWETVTRELRDIAALAKELRLWTVLGSVHRLTPPHRPHNSLYVLSDEGTVATRYDERLLSNTKVSYLYAPGAQPVTFVVDGVRFGLLLGMEVHFPELFAEYERLDVDCVLFSTTGGAQNDGGVFATEARGHAAANGYWVSFAGPARCSPGAPSGVVAPNGQWLARCAEDGTAGLVVVELDRAAPEAATAVSLARPWRRTARTGVYEPHRVTDPRSADRAAF